jgi:RimJ/RimL family protein N-acetyltransferase
MSLPRPVTLAGQAITLRTLLPGDAEAMHAAIVESSPALSTTMLWWHEGFSLNETRDWAETCQSLWDQGQHYEFAILSGPAEGYLGSCAMSGLNKQQSKANLSYWVRTSQTGKGIASQASRLVAQWAFRSLGVQRIEIVVVSTNLPSRGVALKAGATQEGILRNGLWWNGRPYDAVVFSFIPEDFSL